jgi:fructose-bisphosphate aldolase class I
MAKKANVILAQEALYHRAKCDGAARRGEYTAAVEADHRKTVANHMRTNVYAGSAQ